MFNKLNIISKCNPAQAHLAVSTLCAHSGTVYLLGYFDKGITDALRYVIASECQPKLIIGSSEQCTH